MTTKIKINVVIVVMWSSLVSLCCHVAWCPLCLVWVEKLTKTKSWSNSVPSCPPLVSGNRRLTNAVITWNNFSARPLNQDNAPVIIIVDIIFKQFTTIWNTFMDGGPVSIGQTPGLWKRTVTLEISPNLATRGQQIYQQQIDTSFQTAVLEIVLAGKKALC